MEEWIPARGKHKVILHFIVEGEFDRQILQGQTEWFSALGIELSVFPTDGKKNMENKAQKFYEIGLWRDAYKIIFMPDQDYDRCALATKAKLGLDHAEKAIVMVVKREIEAWILADGQCITEAIGLSYQPAGITDNDIEPKDKLYSLIRRGIGHPPTSLEASVLLKSHFSIDRAARNNQSARRFREIIVGISRSPN